jgi:hypothetical protein
MTPAATGIQRNGNRCDSTRPRNALAKQDFFEGRNFVADADFAGNADDCKRRRSAMRRDGPWGSPRLSGQRARRTIRLVGSTLSRRLIKTRGVARCRAVFGMHDASARPVVRCNEVQAGLFDVGLQFLRLADLGS